jgi:spore maturation protein CgeB
MFYHSLGSDWNHGNAHFLRGVAAELIERGHQVDIYEPEDAWSRENLVKEHGEAPLREFQTAYPTLKSRQYSLKTLSLQEELKDADLVLVHEWSDHELVRRVGRHRQQFGGYQLLFHDTHHRAITEPEQMAGYDLTHYDGVLAFGNVLRDLYLRQRWTKRAWTWHEAADTRVFRPLYGQPKEGELVWIGNWGDEERTAELHEFLLEPVKTLGLQARVYGVRYPDHARRALARAGIEYAGWLPNYRAPEFFSRFQVTVHVPRRPYVQALPGIPTIRPFEALACGIPLVSAPWQDSERLFSPGQDYFVARNGEEMTRHLWSLLHDAEQRRELAIHGRQTILGRHTCAHRVDELLSIYEELQQPIKTVALNGHSTAPAVATPTPSPPTHAAVPLALSLLPLAGIALAAGVAMRNGHVSDRKPSTEVPLLESTR